MRRCKKLTQQQAQEINIIIKGKRSGQEVRRAQTILLINDEVRHDAIKTLTGYSRKHAFALRRGYLQDGISAIEDKRKGTPKEILTKSQRTEITALVKTTAPNAHGYATAYWTTGILGDLITQRYGVCYKSRTSVYLLFRQARFTYHKPGRVSERRDDTEVEQWRIQAKKHIHKAWRDPNVVILTQDEMHLSTQTTAQKIWLPKGEYPKIEVARKREARSIYGFLNIKTGDEHAFKTKWQNMYITASIIPEVRKLYPDKNILLIWDQAGWHRGSKAQQAIKLDGKITTMYFPTAAPDENPQEHVWKSGRAVVSHNAFIQDIDVATDAFVAYLNTTKFPYSLVGLSAVSAV